MSRRKVERKRSDSDENGQARIIWIATGCGAVVFAMLGMIVRLGHGSDPWNGDSAMKYYLLPAAAGAIVGGSMGWGLAVARAPQALTRARRMAGWAMLVGWGAVLVPAGLVLMVAWVKGDVGDLTLAGVGHRRPTPMSLDAATQAVAVSAIFVLLLGLPLFTVGGIIGAIVGAKKASRLNETRT